uniref:Helicase ATP-binding domain-containing protein n=1 Tax=Heterorhabditis bacteriophora TaxID=37862 RepID=A0A1I7X233_HETBA
MIPVPSKFCSLLTYRHFTVSTKVSLASQDFKSHNCLYRLYSILLNYSLYGNLFLTLIISMFKIYSIGRNNKQNLLKKRIEAFPPIFKTQLKQWPHLLQLEIDRSNSDKKELLAECGDWSQLEKRGLGVGNLRLLSDAFHPMNGAPVSICVAKSNEQLQPVTDCVLLEFDNKDIAVKVRRSSESVVLGGDTDYAIISSDISGALHSLRNFFKNGMLKKSPGEKLIEYAFRGQQMPSIHNDRMISSISEELNESQRRSVAAALNKKRPFVNIQGPPGTGKTKVVVEIIRQLMMQGQKVLICAPTNVAVDHIMNKTVQSLQGSEVNSYCKGAELDINGIFSNFIVTLILFVISCYLFHLATISNSDYFHDSFASHPHYEELTNICKELEIAHSNRTSLLSRVSVLKRSILKDCYKKSLLVFCTLTSATINHLSMAKWFPEVIIIDEAAQCIEPAAWPAIVRAKRCIMAGDQAQLPAIVKSPE